MNARKCLSITLAVVTGLAVLGTGPASHAGDKRKSLKGSYDVTVLPSGVAAGDCEKLPDGRFKQSHELVAPFSGWLDVTLANQGDWVLYLADTEGAYLAWGTLQWYGIKPLRVLRYHVRRGDTYQIVTCNVAGHPEGIVEYEMAESAGWPKVKEPRRSTLEVDYESPAASRADIGAGICLLGCVSEENPKWARFVEVDITDDLSEEVYAWIYFYDETTVFKGHVFCTSTKEPVPIPAGARWFGVYLYSGPCEDGTPAQATTGTVKLEHLSHRTQ